MHQHTSVYQHKGTCLSPLVPAKACHMAKRRVRYGTRCHMLGPESPEAVLPDRALYLPTFSHLLDCQKKDFCLARARARALSLSLSLSLSRFLSHSLSSSRAHIRTQTHSRIHLYKKVSACTSTQVYISVKCACNSTQVCIRACVCAFEPACVYVRPRVREHTHSTARNITDGRTDGRTDG